MDRNRAPGDPSGPDARIRRHDRTPSATSARDEAEELLGRRPDTAIRLGLDRTRSMLGRLGDPHRRFRSLHIGGTNGKGSAAAVAESVLRRAGARTGLYTSPHLLEYGERFRVDGERVSRTLLEECAAAVRPAADRVEATSFETATALAFLVFRRAEVEVAVVEVGLGGRLDATNVLAPEVSVVTSVARDHSAYLGSDLEEVAREKAGILKPGVPVVLGPLPDRLGDVFARRARELDAPLRSVGRDAFVDGVRVAEEGTSFRYRSSGFPEGVSLHVPLVGAHQAANAATAILALEQLSDPPAPDAIREGVAAVLWPGRFDLRRGRGGRWILDAAHNAASVGALVRTLRAVRPREPTVYVLFVLRDKEWKEMLAPLLSHGTRAVLTVAPSSPPDRRWNPEEVLAAFPDARGEVVRDFAGALDRAREHAGHGTVVVTGSGYAVGDALRWLEA